MIPPIKSLKIRLTLWVFLPTVFISGVDLFITSNTTDNIATLVQQQLLKGSARAISEQLVKMDGSYEISIPPAAFELFASEYKDHVYYAVRSKSGLLIAGSEELPPYQGQLQIEQEKYYEIAIRGEPSRVIAYAQSLPSTSSGDFAITQVAQTLRGHDAFKEKLFLLTMREHLMLLSILIIGLIIAFRWTLSPLIQFGEKLLKRQPGSLEMLDERNAPKELKPVIFAMNDYVARLDKTLTSYEQFVTNTAHQLRTSFAIITSQINFGLRSSNPENTRNEVLTAIRKTILQGTKVINQLLLLASVEQNRHSRKIGNAIQLAEIIQSVIEELAPLAQQKNIDMGIDILDETIQVVAPQYLLHELISNLMDNAIQHIANNGMITVSLRRKDHGVLMQVVDNGPGIPLEEREKVFDRFYRRDESKPNSSGLGLSIVKEICEVMKAEICLNSPENGVGLQVDVTFPIGTSTFN
jgi:two-component system sensor histidine kinase TctE